jgi:hypothetical protein
MSLLQGIPWKYWLPVVGGTLLVALGISAVRHYQHRIATLEASVRVERALKDSANFKEAATRADRDQYRTLLDIARTLGGKPVAGGTVVVRGRDTVVVHDTVPTALASDSTRTAHFHDSTSYVVADGTVVAPPCCAPLRLTYTLKPVPQRAQLLITRVGDRYVATAAVNGDTTTSTVDAPFYVPPAPPRWERYVSAFVDPDAVTGTVGVRLRLVQQWHAAIQAERRFAPNTPGWVQMGVERRW